jgi:hypothetical protein
VLTKNATSFFIPQTLSNAWETELGNNYNTIHKKYLHNIGNLILTEFNGEIGNKPFADKKINSTNLLFITD